MISRAEVFALVVFAGGVSLFAFYVIPRIEFAIAAFDHFIGG